jgi:uncharacterized protein (DUF111 family)
MKKSRPAFVLSVLCAPGLAPAVRETLFVHTTTLGLRESAVSKRMLARSETTVSLPYGTVRVKQAILRGQVLRAKPEYEDLKRLALERGLTIDRILDDLRAAREVRQA